LVTQRHRVADGSWGSIKEGKFLQGSKGRNKLGVGNAPQGEEGERVAGALPGYGITVYSENHKWESVSGIS